MPSLCEYYDLYGLNNFTAVSGRDVPEPTILIEVPQNSRKAAVFCFTDDERPVTKRDHRASLEDWEMSSLAQVVEHFLLNPCVLSLLRLKLHG